MKKNVRLLLACSFVSFAVVSSGTVLFAESSESNSQEQSTLQDAQPTAENKTENVAAENNKQGGLEITKFALCENVINRDPENIQTDFNSSVSKIYLWTQVSGSESPTEIKHIWYYKNNKMAEISLNVNSSPYRTWSFKSISPELIGEWYVEVTDSEGNVLKKIPFSVKSQISDSQPENTQTQTENTQPQ